MRDTCNYVIIINYGIVLLYTIRAKRYSSCQCILCARCRCSDDINFAPSLPSRRQPRFPLSLSPSSEARCPRDANDNEGSPLRKARSHRDNRPSRRARTCSFECRSRIIVMINFYLTTAISANQCNPWQRSNVRLPKEIGSRDFSFRLPSSKLSCHRAFLNFEDTTRLVNLEAISYNLMRLGKSKLHEFLWLHSDELSRTIAFALLLESMRARASHSVKISLASRVKPCVTHDIYKGFSIRKTHIIETTCNILSYRRDTIIVHTYAYVCARGTRATRTRVARVSCTCVACVCTCVPVSVWAFCVCTYIYI